MSARSAQRTRWRRWRMGRDIAGRKDRDGRMGGCQAQIVSGVTTLRIRVSFFFFFKREHAGAWQPLDDASSTGPGSRLARSVPGARRVNRRDRRGGDPSCARGAPCGHRGNLGLRVTVFISLLY